MNSNAVPHTIELFRPYCAACEQIGNWTLDVKEAARQCAEHAFAHKLFGPRPFIQFT